jgi:PKD repeat protein
MKIKFTPKRFFSILSLALGASAFLHAQSGPFPPSAISGSQQVCSGNPVTLTASGGSGTIYWYSGTCGGTLLGMGNSLTVTPAANTTYYAASFDNNQLSSCVSYSVQVNPNPVIVGFNLFDACETAPAYGASSFQVATTNGAMVNQFDWNLGDGNNASNPTFQHVYSSVGNYNVSLLITTNHGCTATQSGSIWVNPKPFINQISASADCEGSPIAFGQTSGVNPLNGSQVTGYSWSFGDGNQSGLSSPNHTYQTNGMLAYSLTVSTQYGCTETANGTVQVFPLPSTDFQATMTCISNEVHFQNSSSISQGSISQYFWDFGNNAGISIDTNPAYMFSAPGVYSITLTAVSDQGCVFSGQAPIQVLPPPVSSFSVGSIGEYTLQFIPVIAEPSWSHSWDFGDGSTSSSVLPTHVYSGSGVYQICLETSNGFCNSITCTNLQLNSTGLSSDFIKNGVDIYPNPLSYNSILAFNHVVTGEVLVAVMDMSGRQLVRLLEGSMVSGLYEISLTPSMLNLPSGSYLLEYRATSGRSVVKFLIP